MTSSSIAARERARPDEPVARESTPSRGGRTTVAAGLLAGAAMLVCAAAGIALAGGSPWRPLALTAAVFGPEGAAGGATSLVAAAGLWLLVSVALAAVFAGLVPRDLTPACAAIAGLGYVIVVLGVVASAALPAVNPLMREEMRENGGAWVLAYAAFGAALGLGRALLARRGAGPREGRPARG